MSSSRSHSRKGKGRGKGKGKEIMPDASQNPQTPTLYQLAMWESYQNFLQTQHDPSQVPQTPTSQMHFQSQTQPPVFNPNFQAQFQSQFRQPELQQTQRPSQNYRDTHEFSDDNESAESEGREFGPLSDEEIQEIAPSKPTKCPPTKWTPNEEFHLAEAVIDIGEDPVVGNNQKSSGYWIRVVNRLRELTDRNDVFRNEHQCNSKWKDLQKKVNAFNEIFNNLKRSKAPSGTNEHDIIEMARQEYQRLYKHKSFKHDRIWQFVRHHPKWACQPPMYEQAPKRTRTNDSNDYSATQPPNAEFVFSEPPRRKGKTPTNSSSATNISDEVSTKFTNFVDAEREAKEHYRSERLRHMSELKIKKIELMDREEKKRDLDIFVRPHDHLSGYPLELVLEQKRELAARWGWRCDF